MENVTIFRWFNGAFVTTGSANFAADLAGLVAQFGPPEQADWNVPADYRRLDGENPQCETSIFTPRALGFLLASSNESVRKQLLASLPG